MVVDALPTDGTKQKTILIVENNELNMNLFNDLLEAYDCNILQARNGMDALRMAREHKPDLILMDIQLPGISGL
jgi:two-component system cell cycle response regulator DivK